MATKVVEADIITSKRRRNDGARKCQHVSFHKHLTDGKCESNLERKVMQALGPVCGVETI